MKYRFILSLFILALTSALVGGATLAFFTSEDTPEPHFFTTGTVEITGSEVEVVTYQLDGGGEDLIAPACIPGFPPDCPIPPPSCDDQKKTITWCVENTGTKRAYIRVKPPESGVKDETAVGEGVKFSENPWWHQYLKYEWYRLLPIVTELKAGQHIHAGWVIIWRDFNNFYVIYITDNGWSLQETHVYAETINPSNQPPNKKAPGNYRFKNENHSRENLYIYTIPVGTFYNGKHQPDVYFVTHAKVVKGGSAWSLNPVSASSWTKGDDGWYYYKDPVAPGEKVCITLDVTHPEPDKTYTLKAEAVQASHNANKAVWPDNPLP